MKFVQFNLSFEFYVDKSDGVHYFPSLIKTVWILTNGESTDFKCEGGYS